MCVFVCVCVFGIIYNEKVLHGFLLIMRMKIDFLNVYSYVHTYFLFNSARKKWRKNSWMKKTSNEVKEKKGENSTWVKTMMLYMKSSSRKKIVKRRFCNLTNMNSSHFNIYVISHERSSKRRRRAKLEAGLSPSHP
jgi:hypothetical protein